MYFKIKYCTKLADFYILAAQDNKYDNNDTAQMSKVKFSLYFLNKCRIKKHFQICWFLQNKFYKKMFYQLFDFHKINFWSLVREDLTHQMLMTLSKETLQKIHRIVSKTEDNLLDLNAFTPFLEQMMTV